MRKGKKSKADVAPRAFGVAKLSEASDALHYEVWMLYETARRLVPPPEDDLALRNALTESFLVHVRTLIDFFTSIPKEADDLVAADFCSGGWTCPPWSITEKDTKVRINKRLSHLTHTRLEYQGDDRTWDLKALVDAFDRPLAAFHRGADRGHPGTLWATAPLTKPFQASPVGPSGATSQSYRGETGPTGTAPTMTAAKAPGPSTGRGP